MQGRAPDRLSSPGVPRGAQGGGQARIGLHPPPRAAGTRHWAVAKRQPSVASPSGESCNTDPCAIPLLSFAAPPGSYAANLRACVAKIPDSDAKLPPCVARIGRARELPGGAASSPPRGVATLPRFVANRRRVAANGLGEGPLRGFLQQNSRFSQHPSGGEILPPGEGKDARAQGRHADRGICCNNQRGRGAPRQICSKDGQEIHRQDGSATPGSLAEPGSNRTRIAANPTSARPSPAPDGAGEGGPVPTDRGRAAR